MRQALRLPLQAREEENPEDNRRTAMCFEGNIIVGDSWTHLLFRDHLGRIFAYGVVLHPPFS